MKLKDQVTVGATLPADVRLQLFRQSGVRA